jgi:hypothetical protein
MIESTDEDRALLRDAAEMLNRYAGELTEGEGRSWETVRPDMEAAISACRVSDQIVDLAERPPVGSPRTM